jgi:hypothetical protein
LYSLHFYKLLEKQVWEIGSYVSVQITWAVMWGVSSAQQLTTFLFLPSNFHRRTLCWTLLSAGRISERNNKRLKQHWGNKKSK